MQLKVLVGEAPSEMVTAGRVRRLAAILVPRSHEHIRQEAYMDFDPRWTDDPRDGDDRDRELSRGSRGGLSNPRERERLDIRDVFTRDLELPRGPERERVWARDSDVRLRGSEVRTLATVGAFRVVPAGDLRDGQDRLLDPHRGDLRRLRDSGLVETIPAIGDDRALVMLTERGRDVLERNRWSNVQRDVLRLAGVEQEFGDRRDVGDERGRPQEPKTRQEFYAGVRSARHTRFAVHRPRELMHDAHVYRAYLKEAERLREQGASIRRVVLDNELKREYQQFLQERNRGRSDSDGRPDRTPEEIHRWASSTTCQSRTGTCSSRTLESSARTVTAGCGLKISRWRRSTIAVVTPPRRRPQGSLVTALAPRVLLVPAVAAPEAPVAVAAMDSPSPPAPARAVVAAPIRASLR